MYISRVVIVNFRNFKFLDVSLQDGVTCIIGENNTGKTNFLHAIRLAVDATLSSQYRQLIEHDIHQSADISEPQQVIISIEFQDYKDNVNECALVGECEVADNVARIHYRFRPRSAIREQILSCENFEKSLTLEDYRYEITGGGAADPTEVSWDQELGSDIRFTHFQFFHVEYLPALRDVRQSLRQSYSYPLGKLLASCDMSKEEKDNLVAILRKANENISGSTAISGTGKGIHDTFSNTAGDAFAMDVKMGMIAPSFSTIARSLTVLLSNDAITDFDSSRNGLGLNNVLYVSILLKYFEQRTAKDNVAGQLLLVEEPEAHLHPQLQRVLYQSLSEKAETCQTILTTHSTHVSSHAKLNSFIVLTNPGNPASSSCVPTNSAGLSDSEINDLERFLDATRSTLLYARKVILVEGPAELFLIPSLVKKVKGIDLDRYGISVIPIHGVHFKVYAKLFGENALRKKCAIVADADGHLQPSDAKRIEISPEEDQPIEHTTLAGIKSNYVEVFQCPQTLERALAIPGLLIMLSRAARELGATRISERLVAAHQKLQGGRITDEEKRTVLEGCRKSVLNTSVRFGKARFAQVASKYITDATEVPEYIDRAVDWLVKQ